MKKYFIEVIPVEGEIKKGDFFQYLGRKDTHRYKEIYKAISIVGSVGIADRCCSIGFNCWYATISG